MAKNKNNAFTIVELLVAMTLLVILIGLSGMVFSTSVKAFRTAGATVEMTRNLRAITGRITTDLNGLQKDAPLFLAFTYDAADDKHFDTIHFFANGDFQTSKMYYYDVNNDGVIDDFDSNGTIDENDKHIVSGNLARVFYGHANTSAAVDYDTGQVLSRKSHVLTANSGIYNLYGEIPQITNAGLIDYTQFPLSFGLTMYPTNTYPDENELEFNTITLTNWVNALNYLDAGNPDNADAFIFNCMSDTARPIIQLNDSDTLHLLMSQGVVQMQIQWAYTIEDISSNATNYVPIPRANTAYFEGIRWWPDVDPLGNGTGTVADDADNDFIIMGSQFGVHLELPQQTTNINWYRIKPNAAETAAQMALQRCQAQAGYFRQDFYPKALKFTFLIKDGRGVFDDGKTFTHIVYLD